MNKKFILYAAIFFCCIQFCHSQKQNNFWSFGHKAAINFNGSFPVADSSSVISRGSCASVCDTNGQLLFYVSYDPTVLIGGTDPVKIHDKTHSVMQNGNYLKGGGWYNEITIVSFPDLPNLYYVLYAGVTLDYGLWYSIVDINQNGGLGSVTQKNIQLQNFKATDGLTAIKHGNGRDWWIISRRWDYVSDEFYVYLVDPSGISGPLIQHSGTATDNGFYRMLFNSTGNKLICVDYRSLVEEFSFDRCTGIITLDRTIHPETIAPFPAYVGCALSSNDRYLYISSNEDTSYLLQLDLQDPLTWDNQDTLWSFDTFASAGGLLKLAPDKKIYFSCAWYDGVNFNYPYPDSVFNMYNNNLSVINYPDSPGVACGFAPFSFNLGAGRTYWGLPNNPDYELGPDTNSMCDTVLSVDSRPLTVDRNSQLHVFYHPGWQIAFINAEGLRGKTYTLCVMDLSGRIVYREEGKLSPPYFTKDLSFGEYSGGIYIVRLQTEREVLSNKFLKE